MSHGSILGLHMVEIGLDILLHEQIGALTGARIGVLANQASVTEDGEHVSDALACAGVNITALFGPEHGVRGDIAPGVHVADSYDEKLGVAVYSLYGERRVPSADSLDSIDIMIVDLQDVGARFYTFVWTMANVMSACGERGIPVWVLDRPNPISGLDPEGPILDPELASFVGAFPIPIRHGLTIGELARLFVARSWVSCELRVVAMRGWERRMFFDETGLRWTKPSPSMLSPLTALCYPGTCLFEGTNVSEGRGTDAPFEMIGAAWVDGDALCRAVSTYELPGMDLIPTSWTVDSECYEGLRLLVSDRYAFRPVLSGVAMLCALRQLHPDEFQFNPAQRGGRLFFDRLAGTTDLRKAIESGENPHDILRGWDVGLARFSEMVADVLIYPLIRVT